MMSTPLAKTSRLQHCPVALVQMPFADLARPSLGLGLLKAALKRSEIESRIFHGNLEFANTLGPDKYALVCACRANTLIGEWIFSKVAFPDYQPEGPELPEILPLVALKSRLGSREKALEALYEVRSHAAAFIQSMAELILKVDPQIVGCSSIFEQNTASLALLRKIKELRPEVVTVMGGANCEGAMGHTLVRHFPWLDFVVSGEADGSFPKLCGDLLSKKNVESLPPGVFGQEHHTADSQSRGTIRELDNLPHPDYDDYFETLHSLDFKGRVKVGLPVETSRGCWWGQKHHCTFCGLNGSGMTYRSKTADRVLSEFASLSERYDCNRLMVVDNIIDMKHLKTVLPTLCDCSYEIFYETKSNLRRDQVELLAKAGIHWIQPGIESMHTEVLKLMDKGSNPMTNVQLLKWAREFGVRVSWNFLVGFPGEEDRWYQEMCQWLPLVSHLQPPSGMIGVRYDRFSPYHTDPDKYGIKLEPLPYYSYIYPLPKEELFHLAYFFRDANWKKQIRPGLVELKEIVASWNRNFWTKNRPIIMSHRERGDRLEILDTRPIATERRLYLEGVNKTVYDQCETAQSMKSLQQKLDLPWDLIENALNELVDLKVLLSIDDRYLALGVAGSSPTLPDWRDYAGGSVLPEVERIPG